jgi:hypothetical protein
VFAPDLLSELLTEVKQREERYCGNTSGDLPEIIGKIRARSRSGSPELPTEPERGPNPKQLEFGARSPNAPQMPNTLGVASACILKVAERVFVLKELCKPLATIANVASALTSTKSITKNVRDKRKFPESIRSKELTPRHRKLWRLPVPKKPGRTTNRFYLRFSASLCG